MSRTNEPKFKLDVAALLPFFDDEGAGAETVGAAFFDELAEQLGTAGAPDAPFEEQVRTLLFAYAEHGAVREALAPAYIHGESDADTARRVLASHAAMQRAGEEMPSVTSVAVLVGEAFADHQVINGGRVKAKASAIVNLFAPHFARLTQERDEARITKQKVDEHVNAAAEVVRLRARLAELEALPGESRGALEDVLESRPELGADVVERFRTVILQERAKALAGPYEPNKESEKEARGIDNGIRAVLSALAAMGWEAIPSHDATNEAAAAQFQDAASRCGFYAGARWYGARLSPVLGALRATIAEQAKRIAESEEALAATEPLSSRSLSSACASISADESASKKN